MSKVIDEKVVQMRFDNQQFEQNVQTSMSTLDKLKQKLNFSNAAKDVNLSPIEKAIESVNLKFSGTQVAAATAISNITNQAVDAGKRIASAFTIEPVKTGFAEYETQINAVQTILANTQHEGTNLQQVNGALDELNEYADKTIYNFTEMTRNIGTFTAAGVDLNTSVDSIKGIANLAAVSGSTSAQASSAMYQLSQALAAGKVSLMDWNSVVNAGMGGKVFQDALVRTSELLGTGAEKSIEMYGSFRDSLTQGEWLTTEVLTETLKQFAGAYSEADLVQQGFSEEQAKEIAQMAETAEDAATKVKTVTQLFDTLKEAAQSGWTQSWEYIIGDFEQAKATLTEVSDTFGGIIQASADARNAVLQEWSELGGRTDLFEGLKNAFEGIQSIIKPVKEAFNEIFPPLTAQQLADFTKGFKELTEKFKISDETADKLKRTFKGVFGIVDIGIEAVKTIGGAFMDLIEKLSPVGGSFLDITAGIGDYISGVDETIKSNGIFESAMDGVVGILSSVADAIGGVIDSLKNLNLGDKFSAIWSVVSKIAGKVKDTLGKLFDWIGEHVSATDIFAGLAGGGIFAAAKKFTKLIDNVKEKIGGLFDKLNGDDSGGGIVDKIKDVLDSVHDALVAFQQGVKVPSLLGIAGAIALLTASLKQISELSSVDITKGLTTIGVMMGELSVAFVALSKTLSKLKPKDILKSAAAMVVMAEAVKIVAEAMALLKDLSWEEIAKGLTTMGVALGEFIGTLALLSKTKVGGKQSLANAAAILLLAQSLDEVAEYMERLGKLSWDETAKGMFSMGVALGEFVTVLAILNKADIGGKQGIANAAAMVLLAQSLDEISEYMVQLAQLSWDGIAKGVTSMGIALGEFVAVFVILEKANVSGSGAIAGAAAILIAAQSLDEIADFLVRFGEISWGEIARGLVAMGGALAEVAGFSGALGKIAGFSGLFGAGTILLAVQGLDEIADCMLRLGQMAWGEIGKSLAAMGGALLELAGISGATGYLTGFAGLMGAGTIALAAQALDEIAACMLSLGQMTWGEIGKGLAAMGGALLELAGISGAAGYLTGIAGLMGAGTITLAAQGLDEIAAALQQFGSMSWEEVKNGLAAMGGALGELALGSIANTLSFLGSISLQAVAKPLGTLADSVRKWSDVTLPENLGGQLESLATGVLKFTWGGLGAGAIAAAAPGIGQMADAVRKWEGVTIPESLGEQLASLATGVTKFTFSGFGAENLPVVAPGLSKMAEAISKWQAITIPENLGASLESIAKGIDGFGLLDGTKISSAASALGNLADGVSKFKDALEGFDAGKLGAAVTTNLADAIKDHTKDVQDAIDDVKDTIINGLKNLDQSQFNEVGANIVKSLASGITNASGTLQNATTNIVQAAATAARGKSSEFLNAGSTLSSNLITGFRQNSGNFTSAGTAVASAGVTGVKQQESSFTSEGTAFGRNLVSGLTGYISKVREAGSTVAKAGVTGVNSQRNSYRTAGSNFASALAGGMLNGKQSVNSAGSSLGYNGYLGVSGYESSFHTSGYNMAIGLANGILDGKSAVINAAREVANAAIDTTDNVFIIASPSKVFMQIGDYIGQGLALGIENSTSGVTDSTEDMANAVLDTARDVLEIHSPSEAFYDYGQLCGEGFAQGLRDSSWEVANVLEDSIYSNYATMGDYIRHLATGDSSLASAAIAYRETVGDWSKADALEYAQDVAEIAKKKLDEASYVDGSAESYAAFYSAYAEYYRAAKNEYEAMEAYAQEQFTEDTSWIDTLLDNSEAYSTDALLDAYDEIVSSLFDKYSGSSEFAPLVQDKADQLYNAYLQAIIREIAEQAEKEGWNLEQQAAELERRAGSGEPLIADTLEDLRNTWAQGSYQRSVDWINAEKDADRLGAVDELAAYTRMLTRYNNGEESYADDQAETIKKNVYSLQKELYEDYEDYIADKKQLDEDYEANREALEDEYKKKVDDINDQLEDDIDALNDEYEDELESRTKSIYNTYGLFDKVSSKDTVKASTLMDNLQDQVDEMNEWQDLLDTLESRDLDSDLLEEIREMGPSSIAEVKALNKMTDSELQQYANLWQEKSELAKDQAVEELTDLKSEVNSKISELREDADDDLDDLKDEYYNKTDGLLTTLEKQYEQSLEDLQDTYEKQVGIVKTYTDEEFTEISERAIKIMKEAGWDELGEEIGTTLKESLSESTSDISEISKGIGASIAQGVEEGLYSYEVELADGFKTVITGNAEVVKSDLGIHSPSKVFAEIGKNVDEGMIVGLNAYSDKVTSTAASMSEGTISAVSDAMSDISYIVQNGNSITPSIRPVIDMRDALADVGYIDDAFIARRTMTLGAYLNLDTQYGQASKLEELSDKFIDANTESNAKVVGAINDLQSDFADLAQKVTQMQLVMDTGALVGAIAPDMDGALGSMAKMSRRRIR